MEYMIKDAAKKLNLSPSTLRYYEKEGLISNILKDKHGHRRYSQQNLEMISIIICLRKTGMSISKIKCFVQLSEMGKGTLKERIDMFLNHRKEIINQIEELKNYLNLIDHKIDRYESKL